MSLLLQMTNNSAKPEGLYRSGKLTKERRELLFVSLISVKFGTVIKSNGFELYAVLFYSRNTAEKKTGRPEVCAACRTGQRQRWRTDYHRKREYENTAAA
jgi:hypothetical protein